MTLQDQARRALYAALKSGRIRKLSTCQRCGMVARVQGHHYRGYAPEHRLDVLWLCRPCHSSDHGRSEQESVDLVGEAEVWPCLAKVAAQRVSLDTLRRLYSARVLADCKGNKALAADRLGIDRKTLYRYLFP